MSSYVISSVAGASGSKHTEGVFTAQEAFLEVGQELADLMKRTARIAQSTIAQMGEKARGSAHDVLDAVRLLSRLKEQCEEALANVQQSLPAIDEQTEWMDRFLEKVRLAASAEAVAEVMQELRQAESTFESTIGRSLRSLAETRFVMLSYSQDQAICDLSQINQRADQLKLHHRSARTALAALSSHPGCTQAIERVGFSGIAHCIDADLDQALSVCHRQLDLLADRESTLAEGARIHSDQLRQTRHDLSMFAYELERAHAVQLGLQGALLQAAGHAMEQLTSLSEEALESIHQDALRAQFKLKQLTFEPIAEAVKKAMGLKGAYGSIRAALMGSYEREQLVHLLENWLLQAAHADPNPLFSQPLNSARWRAWSAHFGRMSSAVQPEWMAWTFEALGLSHPPVPQSISVLDQVVEAYCTARELLHETEPGYDPRGEIGQKILATLDQERTKWANWCDLGMASDRPCDVQKLVNLAQESLPLSSFQEAIQQWQERKAMQARNISDRLRRLVLGDWRKSYTFHEKGTLEAWAQKAIQHYHGYRDRLEPYWKNLRDRLFGEFATKYPPVLANLRAWLEAHGRGLEELLLQRACDTSCLGAPVLEAKLLTQHGTHQRVALRMPHQMERVFTDCLAPTTLTYVRQAEILGLGRLRFEPEMPIDIGNNQSLHWGEIGLPSSSCIYSAREMSKKFVDGAFHYLACPLKWTWIDAAGQEHDIASFQWRDHGRSRSAPIYSPTKFALQDHKDWWAHPSEKIRICQIALDGINVAVSNGDYFTVIGSCAPYGGGWEWPLENEDAKKRFDASSHELLLRFQSVIGIEPADLERRFSQAQPKNWSGEAANAQARLLSYVHRLAKPAAAGAANELIARLTAMQEAAHPEHSAIWQTVAETARAISHEGSEVDAALPCEGLRALPQFSMDEIEHLFDRMQHRVRGLGDVA